jgi:hypothetical protein
MCCCIVKIGKTMPMKIVPMNPAMRNSISGSSRRHRGLQLRSRSPSVTSAMRTSSGVELAALFGDGDHFQHRARETDCGNREALARVVCLPSRGDGFGDGVHEDLVADGFARDVERR